jgi:Fe-S cluster biosynthesis and repair protein YggX
MTDIQVSTEGQKLAYKKVQFPSAIDPAVEEVKKKINALPESDKITVNDKAAIEDAKAAYDKLTSEQKSQIPANILEKLEKSEKALANAEAEEAKEKKVKTVTVNVKTVSAKALDTAVKKAGSSEKYVTSFKLGKKVKKISKSAFKKYKKVTTLTLNTKKLKKKSVKGSLKGSKVKKVVVKVGSKKSNKKYLKKYKKYFTKKNAGKKVKVVKAY